jgi:hypothetical protein
MSLLAGVVSFGSAPANAAVSADINLHIGRRAPAVYFRRAPSTYVIPNSRVYYVQGTDYDMFRFGSMWYINDGGYWYTSRSYRGPFVECGFESVPRVILQVPGRYHRQARGYWGDDQRWRNNGNRGSQGNGQWGNNRRDQGNGQSGNNHRGQGNGRGRNGQRGQGNGQWGNDHRGQDNGQGGGYNGNDGRDDGRNDGRGN